MTKTVTSLSLAVAGVAAFSLLTPATGVAEPVRVVPAPAADLPLAKSPGTAVAVLAGGCFWGLEGVFEHVSGVKDVVSGYAGGASQTARYEIIGSGLTGHAEAVRIVYDPSKISYGQLLRIFFSVATDPTQLNRQGPDSGTQYRSTVFAQTPEQARVAKAYIAQLKPAYDRPIVTTIETGKPFYTAEAHHQNFLRLNPTYGYIVINDLPKVAALKRLFPNIWRG